MAKPMLVTLPLVLLLLDYWPLRRLQIADGRLQIENKPATCNLQSAIVEKVPLLVLSAVASGIAIWAQHEGQALKTLADRPFSFRLENAVVAYGMYLYKMAWPVGLYNGSWRLGLAPFYPIPPGGWPAWQVAASALALLAASAIAWRERRRRPYLLVGWLWYLTTLVPVIGLVPIGEQAWADRYTYLPLIGIFVMLAWGTPDLVGRWRLPGAVLAVAATGVVIASLFLTRVQVGYWHDDEQLWEHTLQVTDGNDIAENNLGTALANQAAELSQQRKATQANARLDKATRHFAQAAALNPRNANAQVNLAKALLLWGERAEAIERLKEALRVNPDNWWAHYWLGIAYLPSQPGEAIPHLQEAVHLNPEDAGAQTALKRAVQLQKETKGE
jgi:protein O-mannosyl-transferase